MKTLTALAAIVLLSLLTVDFRQQQTIKHLKTEMSTMWTSHEVELNQNLYKEELEYCGNGG